jgi:hypothetical protein
MSNFKQAVSWILHCEELDEVQNRFGLTDQQMEDALAVVEMFERIDVESYNEAAGHSVGEHNEFDLLNEVHEWSKK